MPAFVIRRMEELSTINVKTDEDLAFEERFQNLLTNEYTAGPIEVNVETGVDDKSNADTMDEMKTCIGIAITGLGVRELHITIPGVENHTLKPQEW